MSSLLIIYFVSMAVAGVACFLALKSQWEGGVDIDLLDILVAITITITPVLNSFKGDCWIHRAVSRCD